MGAAARRFIWIPRAPCAGCAAHRWASIARRNTSGRARVCANENGRVRDRMGGLGWWGKAWDWNLSTWGAFWPAAGQNFVPFHLPPTACSLQAIDRSFSRSHRRAPSLHKFTSSPPMSAHFQEEVHTQNECHNCGATDDLALCSRCHAAHFCSRKCQKAYWPFHREWCHRNDFADEVERSQPKFARFLRKHGKQAVLKDGE